MERGGLMVCSLRQLLMLGGGKRSGRGGGPRARFLIVQNTLGTVLDCC
jgi:hypothetical protein